MSGRAGRAPVDADEVARLYEESRFLDAFELTRGLWDKPRLAAELSIEELVLAGRLARRLGGGKVSRWLFRKALAANPSHPLVRYYARQSDRPRYHLIDDLRDADRNGDLDTGDPSLKASWLGSQAILWSWVRLFEKSHELLDRAFSLDSEKPWLHSCLALVLLQEDRWEEALEAAEKSFEAAPGMPAAAEALGRTLAKLGRVGEAAGRISSAAASGQSYEVLGLAAWYTAALAERAPKPERERLAEKSFGLAERLAAAAPLADRETRSYIDWRLLDAAFIMEDGHKVRAHAEKIQAPFFKTVLSNMDANPKGRRILVDFKPVFQTHNTCVIASLATVLSSFGLEVDPAALSRDFTYAGTAFWRIRKWAEESSLCALDFVATPESTAAMLKNGVPFIIAYEQDSSAHAMAVVGIDEPTGTAIIHDPAGDRWAQILLDKIGSDEAPFGPAALAIVPAAKKSALDLIPAEESEPQKAFESYLQVRESRGPSAAAELARDLIERFPGHPVARRAAALDAALSGRTTEAYEAQAKLLEEFPGSMPVKKDLLTSLARLGNTALSREILRGIVERKLLPGHGPSQAWQYPPTPFVVQYADRLRMSDATAGEAKRILYRALETDPINAEALHVFGDALYALGEFDDSVLPFRLASSVNPYNDHFARTAADAMRKAGREEDGLRFLSRRRDELGGLVEGGGAWVSLIETLEAFGRAEQAAAAMDEAEKSRPGDAFVASFAANFWARFGEWEKAEAALSRAEATGQKALFLEAAAMFHKLRGAWREALPLCEAWVAECPENMNARFALLDLAAARDGRLAAAAMARQWASEREGNDWHEELLLEKLRDVFKTAEREEILRRRVARNREDGWAFVELAHLLMDKLEAVPPEDREALKSEIAAVSAECGRTAPDRGGNLTLQARLAMVDRDFAKAKELLLRALEINPDHVYCIDSLFECASASPAAEQKALMDEIEKRLARTVGHMASARTYANLAARRFGVKEAEAALERLERFSPDDPEIAEAKASILLDRGQGRTDAEKAVPLLREAIKRHPRHAGVRYTLAHALNSLQRRDEEIEVLSDLVRISPLNDAARSSLSSALKRAGRDSEAESVLREGAALDPLSVSTWSALAELLWDACRGEEAVKALREGLAGNPEAFSLREQLIGRLFDLRMLDEAVAAAREGVVAFPEGAWCWHMLGDALSRGRRRADFLEIEEAFRKALSFNASLFDAADQLSALLTEQKRFDEAVEIVKRQIPLLKDASPALGRLAWITRNSGKKLEAKEELAAALEKWPLYAWGFAVMMDWIEEDEDWERAKQIALKIPPALLDNPYFSSRRLDMLEKAGEDRASLDEQWQKMLSDFPEHENLHLKRFDGLKAAGRIEEAAAVLDALEAVYPRSPPVLAAKVGLLAEKGQKEKALTTALELWALPGGADFGVETGSWEALEDKGWTREAVELAIDAIERGARFRKFAFHKLAENTKALCRSGLVSRHFGKWRASKQVAALERLLASIDPGSPDSGEDRAVVLDQIVGAGRPEIVTAYCRKNEEECRRITPIWQVMGRALVAREDLAGAREWLGKWRGMPGVEMWALANYSLSLRKARGFSKSPDEDLAELGKTSLEALKTLPHDDCALFHSCGLLEADLRQGREREFLEHLAEVRAYVEGPGDGQWMPEGLSSLPKVFPIFEKLLGPDSPGAAWRLTRDLKKACPPGARSWVFSAWKTGIAGRAGFGRRLLTALYLAL